MAADVDTSQARWSGSLTRTKRGKGHPPTPASLPGRYTPQQHDISHCGREIPPPQLRNAYFRSYGTTAHFTCDKAKRSGVRTAPTTQEELNMQAASSGKKVRTGMFFLEGRGELSTARKPPRSTTALTLMSMVFLVCRPSSGFVVAPSVGVASMSGAFGVPPVSSISIFSTRAGRLYDIRSCNGMSLPSSSRFIINGSGMPENNVPPATCVSTSSAEAQSGMGVEPGRGLQIESEIFASTPGYNKSLETALAGFGDIMGGGEYTNGGQEGGLLCHFDAMERVVLTANGNLQRLISSYYNSPVTVDVIFCREVEPTVYEREVEICIFGRVFCIAKSLVVVHNPASAEAVKTGKVGLGQLFRSLNILPNFELLNAGHRTRRTSNFEGNENTGDSSGGENEGEVTRGKGGFWRVYDLRSEHVSCRIYEDFSPGLFDLERSGQD